MLHIQTAQKMIFTPTMRLTLHHQRLQSQATYQLKQVVMSLVKFCELVDKIYKLKAWRKIAKTWREYVRKTWDLDDSRIRQYRAALPYAKKIAAAMPDLIASDTVLRRLKKVVSADNPLMPAVHQLGQEIASKKGKKTPTESIYRHCLATLEENEMTGGFISYGGGQLPAQIEGALRLSTLEKMQEAEQRQLDRLGVGKTKIKCEATRLPNGHYAVTSDQPLPDKFQFNVWTESE